MSKAFTREDQGLENEESIADKPSGIPAGAKNYITPNGAARMREELKDLLDNVRPKITEIVSWAAALGDRSENGDYIYNKKKLREIDKRIHFLTKRLETIEVVDPTEVKSQTNIVRFGATVTIKYEDEKIKTYSIVGVDEINLSRGFISWVSPLGSVLLKNRVGDFVTLRSPKGEEEIEIVKVDYCEIK